MILLESDVSAFVISEDAILIVVDRLVRLLGQGTFGKVVEAVDPTASKRVAIKIIRAIPKYREASTIEIRVLKLLKERDPHNIQ
jgi:dual-specificity kinase